MDDQFTLTELENSGIVVRAAVEGRGPLVSMVHG
jgi:predicted transcriptional regulator